MSILVIKKGGALIRKTHGDFDRRQDDFLNDTVVSALVKSMAGLFQTRFPYCLKVAYWLLMLEGLAASFTLQAVSAP